MHPPVALHLGRENPQMFCLYEMREGEEIMSEKETYGPKDALAGLAKEIGYPNRFHRDPAGVLASWTRLLAELAVLHTTPALKVGESTIGCPHMDSLVAWNDTIQRAPADEMRATCEAIHKAILDIDCDDGWPTDRALSALNNVCLGAKFGLEEDGPIRTRWPAEASQSVWSYVVCGGHANGNDVVSISRAAWQRHLFGQALALVERPRRR